MSARTKCARAPDPRDRALRPPTTGVSQRTDTAATRTVRRRPAPNRTQGEVPTSTRTRPSPPTARVSDRSNRGSVAFASSDAARSGPKVQSDTAGSSPDGRPATHFCFGRWPARRSTESRLATARFAPGGSWIQQRGARRALPSYSVGHPSPRRRVIACVRERSRATVVSESTSCLLRSTSSNMIDAEQAMATLARQSARCGRSHDAVGRMRKSERDADELRPTAASSGRACRRMDRS